MSPGERIVNAELTEDELKVELLDGRTVTVPLAWYPRLLHASPEQRANWKVAGDPLARRRRGFEFGRDLARGAGFQAISPRLTTAMW